MRAVFEDITAKKGRASFLAYSFTVKGFEFKWHYHPEYELTLIERGSGKRLVGDSYENFEAGDLVLIGPELPHTWASSDKQRGPASAVVIQFPEAFIESFLQHNEFLAVRKLLACSRQGLFFSLNTSRALAPGIKELTAREGADKVLGLLRILDQLCGHKSQPLASAWFQPIKGEENERRINKVCRYIQHHSSERISLPKVASLIHLSESAFCKFFKRATGKTFSDYVNDIRIGHACYLLTESDKTIGTIAHETGFESLTYFNRIFLKKKGLRPGEFRKRLRHTGTVKEQVIETLGH
jgi:AraC-like DNA-binding protein/quercetin dioxygenase-like cupin family protein